MFRAVALVSLAACASGPDHSTVKRPNNSLIVGDFERKPPEGTNAIRFDANGEVRVAKDRSKLDSEPTEASGAWTIDNDQLTLTYLKGMCSEGPKVGVYKVVISSVGIRFTKVSDSCERRSRMDGQTWWRIK
ncbi:MAG TPA: hypothetical protein VGO00_21205 [Kofleriaceae bacterium]|jgi:hypothetical protein|nr:hypothetical protein [Kofleriaceae bacterium]